MAISMSLCLGRKFEALEIPAVMSIPEADLAGKGRIGLSAGNSAVVSARIEDDAVGAGVLAAALGLMT